MTVSVNSFTIYHSVNAYLGTVLLRRSLAAKAGAVLVRRPVFVPRSRGVLIAELLGGKENRTGRSRPPWGGKGWRRASPTLNVWRALTRWT